MTQLKFILDPGHGWLEVPVELYEKSGVKSSQCSYFCKKRGMVYLEEDCDAPRFLDAMKKRGEKITLVEVFQENTFVRNLQRMIE